MPLFDLMQVECDPVLHTLRLTNCAEGSPGSALHYLPLRKLWASSSCMEPSRISI